MRRDDADPQNGYTAVIRPPSSDRVRDVAKFPLGSVQFMKDSEVLILGEKLPKKLFKLHIRVIFPNDDLRVLIASLSTWHERLGHVHFRAIKHLASNNMVECSNFDGSASDFFCEPCKLGYAHRLLHDQQE